MFNRLAGDADRLGEEDQARLLAGLAELSFRAGNTQLARAFCKRLAESPLHQNDLRLRLFVFDLAVQDGNDAEMQAALRDVQAVEQSNGPFTHFATAVIHIRKARQIKDREKQEAHLEEAMRELDRLAEVRSSWSKLSLARAEIYELRGQPEMMIAELQNAVRGGESNAAVVGKLVAALYARQRYKDAFDELKRAGNTIRANSDLHRFAAGLALWKEDPTTALDHARQAVAAESTNYRDLVWLGQMLELTNKKEESLAKLYQAIQLAPHDPVPYVVLVQTLAARGRDGEAKGWIEKVEKQVEPSRRPLALAQCYEIVNEPERAARYYDEAMQARPDDIAVIRAVVSHRVRTNRVDSATEILRRVASGKIESANEDDRAWARNALALVLASGSDYGRFREALGLVGIQLDDSGRVLRDSAGKVRIETTESVLTRARVLASQPIRGFRDRAIELFEVLDSKQALTPNDKYTLAVLYNAAGQWDKAREQLAYLVTQYHQAWHFRTQYIQLLVQHGELAQAEVELKNLEELEKKNHAGTSGYGSEELRTALLEKSGKKDEAIDLMRRIAARPGSGPDRKVTLLGALVRADSLRRSNEAFSLCKELWSGWPDSRVSAESLGAVTLTLLRNMRPTDDHVKELEHCLRAALERDPRLIMVRLYLADLEDMRSNCAAAEQLYREVLEKQPNNPFALNNLAWLRSQFDNKHDEGLELIDKAIASVGRRAELLDTRALILLKLNRTDEAVAELRDVVGDTPTAQRLFHLGRALHQAQDRTGADKALQEAKKLGLSAEKLHPREQQVYVDLAREYRLQ